MALHSQASKLNNNELTYWDDNKYCYKRSVWKESCKNIQLIIYHSWANQIEYLEPNKQIENKSHMSWWCYWEVILIDIFTNKSEYHTILNKFWIIISLFRIWMCFCDALIPSNTRICLTPYSIFRNNFISSKNEYK